jgi:hypothetical protein
MGCEPRGFGWSATVEVCSARVTRLVTDQEKSEKFPGAKLVPGTGLAPDVWTRFASIPILGSQWCLAPSWGAVPGTELGGWFASIQTGRSRCLAPG